ncbi:hypothetical protein [Nostoc sp. UHCC 0252]|uniref:hypothetical protein n=1 Tax=Nostoc sp. UHCC 0252 TaxID=3110241 RepID=UPI002B1FD0B9|nr:hypothetical protein [Nostoc sp. UHCC 0252]MEA5600078.1 hypothetical protein [Nostoc sp. UHCC 0252]
MTYSKAAFTYSFWCFPQAKAALAYSKAAFAYSFWCFPQVKQAFAYSFWCFPQAKAAFTFSNPSLLTHFSNSRICNSDRFCSKSIADLPEFSQPNLYVKLLR